METEQYFREGKQGASVRMMDASMYEVHRPFSLSQPYLQGYAQLAGLPKKLVDVAGIDEKHLITFGGISFPGKQRSWSQRDIHDRATLLPN